MGLFSFGNKEGKRSKHASRQRSAPVGRASEEGPGMRQDALLDPLLPEKQRARRRLVGALALIVAAIVVLPMVLDSQPKPAPDDIAIQIPKSLFESCNEGSQSELGTAYSSICESTVHRAPQAPKQISGLPAAASPNLANKQTTQSVPTTQNSAARQPAAQSTASASVTNASKPSSNTKPAPRPAPAADAAASSRFVIQLIALSDEQRAQTWVKRLKQANVPAYLERKKQNDRRELWLVRAGPFNDRASAQAALKRIRETGLPLSSKAPQTLQQN